MALDKDDIASSSVENTSKKACERDLPHEGILAKINRIVRSVRFALPVLAILGFGKGCAHHVSERESVTACEKIKTIIRNDIRGDHLIFATYDEEDTKQACEHNSAQPSPQLREQLMICQDTYTKLQAIDNFGIMAGVCGNFEEAERYYELGIQIISKDKELQSHPIRHEFERSLMILAGRKSTCKDLSKKIDKIDACENGFIKLEMYVKLGKKASQYKPEEAIQYFEKAKAVIEELYRKLGKFNPKYIYTDLTWQNATSNYSSIADNDGSIVEYSLQVISQGIKKNTQILEKQRTSDVSRKLRNSKEVLELQDLLARAKRAEMSEDYAAAESLFHQAAMTGERVAYLFREAGIAIPQDINELGLDIRRGLQYNQAMIGIKPPAPPKGIDQPITFGEMGEMIADVFKALAPHVGAAVLEINEKLNEKLHAEGFTARLEIHVVKPELLSNKPIEEVEITITQETPHSSYTWKTSKEGLISSGGYVSFFLKPGVYQISSPAFVGKIEREIKEGQNDLTVEVRE